MKSKIIFQSCNFNYIYFLFYIIVYIIILIIEEFLYTEELIDAVKDKFSFYTNKHMLEIFILTLSDFFAIIPYYIIKKKLRKNNDNKKEEKNIDNENKKKTELIYNESKQSATKLKQKEIKS